MKISGSEYAKLHSRLLKSSFRNRFHLNEAEKAYVYEKGIPAIEQHAEDIVRKRLVNPVKDGKQTPMKGHPVFIAQHATATCCRGCIAKWHGISANALLTDDDIEYIISVIMLFIENEMKDYQPQVYGQLELFL